MSVVLRPFLEKAEIKSLKSDTGEGMSLLAALKLALVASLLPNCTVHEGPPNCNIHVRKYIYIYIHINTIFELLYMIFGSVLCRKAYCNNGVTSSNGKNVSARHNLLTCTLNL